MITAYTESTGNFTPYHPNYGSIENSPIVQAATAYSDTETGVTYILVINQANYVGNDLKVTLINPNQLWSNGLVVDNCTRHLAPDPSLETHSIFVPSHNLRIHLQLKGVLSCFPSRYPSSEELESCIWVELTSSQEWNPHDSVFLEAEECCKSEESSITHHQSRQIYQVQVHPTLDEIAQSLVHNVKVAAVSTSQSRSTSSLKDKVTRPFRVGLKTAEQSIKATTQLALRRYRTDIAQLRYPPLSGPHGEFHTDTFFASVPSLSNCTMGHLFTHDLHLCKFYPMQPKITSTRGLDILYAGCWHTI
jgi:hypothetical protein